MAQKQHKYRTNLSNRILVLPSGKVVDPGGQFHIKDAHGLNVNALYRGGTISKAVPKKRSE